MGGGTGLGGSRGTGGTTGTGGESGSGGTTARDAAQDSSMACGNRICDTSEHCCNNHCSACVPQGEACTVLACSPDGGGYEVYPNDCAWHLSGDYQFCTGKPGQPHFYMCDSSVLADPCVSLGPVTVGGVFCCP
ncbi:MAG TPA: hypothetical protein VJ801_01340 [Polyangia bacterium]|nr:hypothetical protein [Polyangia bacterium]